MPTDIKVKVEHVLTEARMVLPGTQAFLGFQFAAVLSEGFNALESAIKLVHLASMVAVAASAALLMAPASLHRLAERGEDSQEFYDSASRLMLAAMGALALGMSLDYYVILRVAKAPEGASAAGSAFLLIVFVGYWFLWPSFRARRS